MSKATKKEAKGPSPTKDESAEEERRTEEDICLGLEGVPLIKGVIKSRGHIGIVGGYDRRVRKGKEVWVRNAVRKQMSPREGIV